MGSVFPHNLFLPLFFLIVFYSIANKRDFFSIFNQFCIAILVACVCFLSDICIFKLKYKKIKISEIENVNFTLLFFLLIFIPLLEEMVFRGALYFFLGHTLIGKIFYILLSSIFFGLNHIIYSKINIVTKIFWGVFLSILFLFFNNIILCIISHITSNFLIFFTGKIVRGRK